MITCGHSTHRADPAKGRALLCSPARFTSETGSKLHALDIACRKKKQGNAVEGWGRDRALVSLGLYRAVISGRRDPRKDSKCLLSRLTVIYTPR